MPLRVRDTKRTFIPLAIAIKIQPAINGMTIIKRVGFLPNLKLGKLQYENRFMTPHHINRSADYLSTSQAVGIGPKIEASRTIEAIHDDSSGVIGIGESSANSFGNVGLVQPKAAATESIMRVPIYRIPN